jgi:hypothetical protein
MPYFDDFDDFDDEKESVTYTPDGGEAKTIQAVINDNFPNQEDYLGRGLYFAVAELHAAVADISNPQHGDVFTFHGHSWNVGPEGYTAAGTNVLVVNLIRLLTDE